MATSLDRSGQSFATMYEAVRHWAALTPHAPALYADGRMPLCYRDLLQLIEAIGAELGSLGIGRSDRVAVLHPGGAEMAVVIMGIWSHATAAPLNPNYTLGEFAVYLRDLRIKALAIAEGMDSPARHVAARLGLPVFEIVPAPATGGDAVGTITLKGAPAARGVQAVPAQPDDFALLLTTSGTTSHSKIVPIRHCQLLARCGNAAGLLELGPEDRCLNLMPLYHSHGLNSGLGVSMVTGGSAMPMPQFDVARFFHYVETLDPTWFTAVFTFHHQIHAHAKSYETVLARSRLRFIHTSSGRLDPRIAGELESWFGVPMLGTYASTETGPMTGDSHPPALRKRDSVGTPAGPEVAIRSADGTVLPAGMRGEVCVRGPNVFDGYENDAEATAAALADGWFRTGDEGLFDEDGFLFLTGRVKETINRGGEKISPSEIDDALRRHPAVAAATAFALPHATLGEEVAAAVVLKTDAAPGEKDLTEFLRQHLTAFKVPRRILVVDEIPVGPTGKVQRHTLAAAFGLEKAVEDARAATVADNRAATPLERQLQSLWGRTLGLPQVGLDDDFFLLGGDSLQAVELFLGIEETLGRRLPRSVLFEANTIAEMAKRIESSSAARCLVPIQAAGSLPAFFCVHDIYGQALIFRALARHLGPDQPFYGLQSVGLDGLETPLARIGDMAARYVAEIRRVQPEGPYYLGGYSMGGLIAYEMAQQLCAAGQNVAMLALFDTYQHHGRHSMSLSGWIVPDGSPLPGPAPSFAAPYFVRQMRTLALNAGTILWRGLFGTAWRFCEAFGMEIPKRLHKPIAANLLAIRSYRISRYDGDAVLFTAARYAWDREDWQEGWHDLIGGNLEIQPISGEHHEIMEEPHVAVLARALTECLRERRHDGYRGAPRRGARISAKAGSPV